MCSTAVDVKPGSDAAKQKVLSELNVSISIETGVGAKYYLGCRTIQVSCGGVLESECTWARVQSVNIRVGSQALWPRLNCSM